MVVEPQGADTCGSSTFAIFVDSDPFRGLLLTVLGPEAISMIVEPRGALSCQSSTITIVADSGPFRGLSLILSGSRSDFHN